MQKSLIVFLGLALVATAALAQSLPGASGECKPDIGCQDGFTCTFIPQYCPGSTCSQYKCSLTNYIGVNGGKCDIRVGCTAGLECVVDAQEYLNFRDSAPGICQPIDNSCAVWQSFCNREWHCGTIQDSRYVQSLPPPPCAFFPAAPIYLAPEPGTYTPTYSNTTSCAFTTEPAVCDTQACCFNSGKFVDACANACASFPCPSTTSSPITSPSDALPSEGAECDLKQGCATGLYCVHTPKQCFVAPCPQYECQLPQPGQPCHFDVGCTAGATCVDDDLFVYIGTKPRGICAKQEPHNLDDSGSGVIEPLECAVWQFPCNSFWKCGTVAEYKHFSSQPQPMCPIYINSKFPKPEDSTCQPSPMDDSTQAAAPRCAFVEAPAVCDEPACCRSASMFYSHCHDVNACENIECPSACDAYDLIDEWSKAIRFSFVSDLVDVPFSSLPIVQSTGQNFYDIVRSRFVYRPWTTCSDNEVCQPSPPRNCITTPCPQYDCLPSTEPSTFPPSTPAPTIIIGPTDTSSTNFVTTPSSSSDMSTTAPTASSPPPTPVETNDFKQADVADPQVVRQAFCALHALESTLQVSLGLVEIVKAEVKVLFGAKYNFELRITRASVCPPVSGVNVLCVPSDSSQTAIYAATTSVTAYNMASTTDPAVCFLSTYSKLDNPTTLATESTATSTTVALTTRAVTTTTSTLGGLVPITVTDGQMISAISCAMLTINDGSGLETHLIVGNVYSTKRQLVAGFLYTFTFDVHHSNCTVFEPSKDYCVAVSPYSLATVKVWVQVWVTTTCGQVTIVSQQFSTPTHSVSSSTLAPEPSTTIDPALTGMNPSGTTVGTPVSSESRLVTSAPTQATTSSNAPSTSTSVGSMSSTTNTPTTSEGTASATHGVSSTSTTSSLPPITTHATHAPTTSVSEPLWIDTTVPYTTHTVDYYVKTTITLNALAASRFDEQSFAIALAHELGIDFSRIKVTNVIEAFVGGKSSVVVSTSISTSTAELHLLSQQIATLSSAKSFISTLQALQPTIYSGVTVSNTPPEVTSAESSASTGSSSSSSTTTVIVVVVICAVCAILVAVAVVVQSRRSALPPSFSQMTTRDTTSVSNPDFDTLDMPSSDELSKVVTLHPTDSLQDAEFEA